MNKQRRMLVDAVYKRVELLKIAVENLPSADDINTDLTALQEEELSAIESLPEGLQTDEKREPSERLAEAGNMLEGVASAITSMVDELQECMEALDNAK